MFIGTVKVKRPGGNNRPLAQKSPYPMLDLHFEEKNHTVAAPAEGASASAK
jgi:hypothetical protein